MSSILAWHFLRADGSLRDGSAPPADGVPLVHSGPVEPCVSGLHASERALDALTYAPGALVCRVRCEGTVVYHGSPTDKLACSRRTILWRADAAGALRAFARWCALGVSHLWDMPDVTRRFLETGDESLRADAWSAARADARDANPAARAASAAAWAASDVAWAASDAARAAVWAASDAARAAQNVELERLLLALQPRAEVQP